MLLGKWSHVCAVSQLRVFNVDVALFLLIFLNADWANSTVKRTTCLFWAKPTVPWWISLMPALKKKKRLWQYLYCNVKQLNFQSDSLNTSNTYRQSWNTGRVQSRCISWFLPVKYRLDNLSAPSVSPRSYSWSHATHRDTSQVCPRRSPTQAGLWEQMRGRARHSFLHLAGWIIIQRDNQNSLERSSNNLNPQIENI